MLKDLAFVIVFVCGDEGPVVDCQCGMWHRKMLFLGILCYIYCSCFRYKNSVIFNINICEK